MKTKSTLLAFFLLSAISGADYEKVYIVHAKDFDMVNSPVYADVKTTELNENTHLCFSYKGGIVPAQIETLDNSQQRIWWIVNLKAGESVKYKLRVSDKCQADLFSWVRQSNYSTRLVKGNQPVIQYEHPVYNSNDIMNTHKPYHQVFDPEGTQFITKGLGGLEPHHKGIFFGYSQVFVNNSKINIWGSVNGERCEHVEIIKEFTGPVMGGHIVKIFWKDQAGVSFIEEIRQIRVFYQPEGESLIDFSSVLRSIEGPVQLKGDRQHAGVQFRAAQYVADNNLAGKIGNTTFIRPGDRSHVKPDKEIDGSDMVDMPWDAMNFEVEGKRYTVAYLSHPSNPDGAEMSERRYGRFGEYFPYTLTKDNPLKANYRFWVKAGSSPSVESIDLRYKAYAGTPVVEVK